MNQDIKKVIFSWVVLFVFVNSAGYLLKSAILAGVKGDYELCAAFAATSFAVGLWTICIAIFEAARIFSKKE